jgi:hypothetical protein
MYSFGPSVSITAQYIGAGTNYVVKTPAGVFYIVCIDENSDAVFKKSTDGGATWSATTVIFTGTVANLSIWFDRWSGISAGLIHCAYTESGGHDTLYRSIDTENSDTLGTQTTIFAGASAASGGALSICRARGGNLYCKTMIDAGAEGGFYRSTDTGGTWGARTDSEALATTDQWILMPGWAADNQDMMMFFWDASADEISRCLYDDSANTWAEASIAATMLDNVATNNFPNFAAAVDTTNSRNLLVAWSAVDAANQDLRCWHVTESAITEVTAVVSNATDDCGLCCIGIDTDTEDWYVFFAGNPNGNDTWTTALSINYKKSTDDGATWGALTSVLPRMVSPQSLVMTPRFDTENMMMIHSTGNFHLALFDVPAAAGGGRAIQINNPSVVA